MKKLIVSSVVVATLLGGGVGGYKAYSKNNEEKKNSNSTTNIETLNSKLDKLYSDENKSILAPLTTIEQVNEITDGLKELEGQEFKLDQAQKLNTILLEAGYAKEMLNLKNATSKLFDKNGAVVNIIDLAGVQKLASQLKPFKPEFVADHQKLIDQAKKQQSDNQIATNKVNALFTTNARTKIKAGISRSTFKNAKSSVSKVKKTSLRTTLNASLNKVDIFLTKKEKDISRIETKKNVTASNKINKDINNNTTSPNTKSSSTTTVKQIQKSSETKSSNNSKSISKKGSWSAPKAEDLDWSQCEKTDSGYINGNSGNKYQNYECNK